MPEHAKYTHETLRTLVGVWIDPLSEVGLATLVNAHADAWQEQLSASQERVRDLEALLGDARVMLGLPRKGPWESDEQLEAASEPTGEVKS